MSPTELAKFLGEAIQARLPVLITGAPGIGKSDIVSQAAEAADADIIISHPAVADPTDAKGLPWVGKDAESATFLPFGELAQALKADKPTVWFLDDLGQATAAVQASFMQLLLARRVNGHKLSDHVTFVAATNRRTDRAGVSGVLEPVKSRFASIVELEPVLDDWCSWALNNDLPAELVAFIRLRPELLCNFEASSDLTQSPVPRTWAHAAKLLELNLPKDVRFQALAGAVGAGAASEFTAFLDLHRKLPSIDAILLDPENAVIPEEPDLRYAVVTGLGTKASPETFGRIAIYAQRLYEHGHGEFAAMLLKDSRRRDESILNTPEFVKLISGELGQLIQGKVD